MELCSHCGEPTVLHMGFDHGKGLCLVAYDRIGLSLRHGQRAAEVIQEVNRWAVEREEQEAATRELGAFI